MGSTPLSPSRTRTGPAPSHGTDPEGVRTDAGEPSFQRVSGSRYRRTGTLPGKRGVPETDPRRWDETGGLGVFQLYSRNPPTPTGRSRPTHYWSRPKREKCRTSRTSLTSESRCLRSDVGVRLVFAPVATPFRRSRTPVTAPPSARRPSLPVTAPPPARRPSLTRQSNRHGVCESLSTTVNSPNSLRPPPPSPAWNPHRFPIAPVTGSHDGTRGLLSTCKPVCFTSSGARHRSRSLPSRQSRPEGPVTNSSQCTLQRPSPGRSPRSPSGVRGRGRGPTVRHRGRGKGGDGGGLPDVRRRDHDVLTCVHPVVPPPVNRRRL